MSIATESNILCDPRSMPGSISKPSRLEQTIRLCLFARPVNKNNVFINIVYSLTRVVRHRTVPQYPKRSQYSVEQLAPEHQQARGAAADREPQHRELLAAVLR